MSVEWNNHTLKAGDSFSLCCSAYSVCEWENMVVIYCLFAWHMFNNREESNENVLRISQNQCSAQYIGLKIRYFETISFWHKYNKSCIQEQDLYENILRSILFQVGGGDNMVIFKNHSCTPLDHCSYTTEVWKKP